MDITLDIKSIMKDIKTAEVYSTSHNNEGIEIGIIKCPYCDHKDQGVIDPTLWAAMKCSSCGRFMGHPDHRCFESSGCYCFECDRDCQYCDHN